MAFVPYTEKTLHQSETLSSSADQKQLFGQTGEQLVAKILLKQGWQILAQNFRGRGFELDIIAVKGFTVIIVEVKSRKSQPKVHQDRELISARKRIAITRGITAFLEKSTLEWRTIRIDLALIIENGGHWDLRYFPNAIEPLEG